MNDDSSGSQIGEYRSVVDSDDDPAVAERIEAASAFDLIRTVLVDRARNGDRTALLDARADRRIFADVLGALVDAANSNDELFETARLVASDESLYPSERLVSACLDHWKETPQGIPATVMLNLASRSDSPRVFERTVVASTEMFLEGGLGGVSAESLSSLFESEFWLLSSQSRNSGAGFILKETIIECRRLVNIEP